MAVAASRLAPGRVSSWTDGAEAVPSSYLRHLRRAGVEPAMIGPADEGPGQEAPGGDTVVSGPWAGLVLCGGADVDPSLYGAEPDPAVYGVDAVRDHFEITLVRAALAAHLPVLAICRGLQVLNVALGGTLTQHLPDRPDTIAHGVPVGSGAPATHPVAVVPRSRLSAAVGGADRIETCVSIHHQAIDHLAGGLLVSARSRDGLVEAVEPIDQAGWCVAVQWHPERSAVSDPVQQAIFDAFAEAASRHVALAHAAPSRAGLSAPVVEPARAGPPRPPVAP